METKDIMELLVQKALEIFFQNLSSINFLKYLELCDEVIQYIRKEHDPNFRRIEVGWDWLDDRVEEYANTSRFEKREKLRQIYKSYAEDILKEEIANLSQDLQRAKDKTEALRKSFYDFVEGESRQWQPEDYPKKEKTI